MLLKSLVLVNFRNYPRAQFAFSPGLNLILGPNASGKTNLLEAIYLLASGTSFRASKTSQLINWGQNQALVEAQLDQTRLKITLERVDGRVKKRFWVDQREKSRRQFLTLLTAIIFRPEELRLLTGSPARRRRFLDQFLAPIDWSYRRALLAYEKARRRRNRLLEAISQGQARPQELFYWDQALAKNGEIIRQKRVQFLEAVNRFLAQSQFSFWRLVYQPRPVTLARLQQQLDNDLARGATSLGPHRDDFYLWDERVSAPEKNLAYWGSRGQQRLAVLALKLAQINFIQTQLNQTPILLLDDLFSELDQTSASLVRAILSQEGYQFCLTSAQETELNGLANQVISLS